MCIVLLYIIIWPNPVKFEVRRFSMNKRKVVFHTVHNSLLQNVLIATVLEDFKRGERGPIHKEQDHQWLLLMTAIHSALYVSVPVAWYFSLACRHPGKLVRHCGEPRCCISWLFVALFPNTRVYP